MSCRKTEKLLHHYFPPGVAREYISVVDGLEATQEPTKKDVKLHRVSAGRAVDNEELWQGVTSNLIGWSCKINTRRRAGCGACCRWSPRTGQLRQNAPTDRDVSVHGSDIMVQTLEWKESDASTCRWRAHLTLWRGRRSLWKCKFFLLVSSSMGVCSANQPRG